MTLGSNLRLIQQNILLHDLDKETQELGVYRVYAGICL